MTTSFNDRAFDRFELTPMYTQVTVTRIDAMTIERIDGHVYDVSEAGVRIELDTPVCVDERVTVELRLPAETAAIFATGRVVWVNDAADDPGPRRLAIEFTRFLSDADRDRLVRHLGFGTWCRAA